MAVFSFKTLAENLLTLEINTIVKPDMVACKMPASRREALWQIAGEYHLTLLEYGCRDPIVWTGAGMMAFREFRERAGKGIEMHERELQLLAQQHGRDQEEKALRIRERLAMLTRIQIQSDQLISLFTELACPTDEARQQFDYHQTCQEIEQRHADTLQTIADYNARQAQGPVADRRPVLSDVESSKWNNDLRRQDLANAPDLTLSAAQVGLIRKVWEIGVERIVLQTVIHADGDITTRMAERFSREFNETILQIHNRSVDSSVGFWVSLVRTVGEMAGNLLGGKLLGK